MYQKNFIRILLTIGILHVFSYNVIALMPPHLVRTTPHNGGLLEGNTLTFYGYSLKYTEIEDLLVINLTTNNKVEISTDLSCEWEGEGDCRGCQQQYCILRVTLLKVYPGHEYEANFLGWKIRFTSICDTEICHHAPEKLFRFEKNEKWGYKDLNGKIIIESQFIIANDFSPEGIAAVADEKSWYYIDKKGKKLITPLLFDNGPDYFSEGLARFTAHDKIGFFDKHGEVIIEARFDFAWPFHEDLAVVCMGCRKVPYNEEYWKMIGGQWGYINKKGNIVIPLKFESASRFENGKARVKFNGKKIYIDKKGNLIE